MRASTLLPLLLSAFGASHIIYVMLPPPDSPGRGIPGATPAPAPTFEDPIQTAAAAWLPENLELRQAPAAAPAAPPVPGAPAVPPAAPPAANPPAANPPAAAPPAAPPVPGVPANPQAPGVPVPPAVPAAPNAPPAPVIPPAANPSPTTTTTLEVATAKISESVTVQWVETWIDGSQTWNPHTITYRYLPFVSQAPQPGFGEIGMGTLTGEVGKTKTLVMGGAAVKATQVPAWGKGMAAAVGVGLAGIVV